MPSKKKEPLQMKLDQLKSTLHVDFIGIALATTQLTTQKKEIRWRYVSGNLSQRYQKIVLQVGQGFAGIVWRTGRRLLEHNLEQKTATELLAYPIAIAESLKSVIVEPIMYEEQVVAILLVGFRQVNQLEDKLLTSLETVSAELIELLITEQVVI